MFVRVYLIFYCYTCDWPINVFLSFFLIISSHIHSGILSAVDSFYSVVDRVIQEEGFKYPCNMHNIAEKHVLALHPCEPGRVGSHFINY
jgi:hypothetical protein